jgi:threonine/homoserine/homoserine lactone efflux protein
LSTGLILQLAIGPVFLYISNIALQRTLYDGFSAIAAVTLVDYIYIILAVLGVGKLLERNNLKTILGIICSIVLILFGGFMIINSFDTITTDIQTIDKSYKLFSSFSSAFFLTASNPLTIVFWTGLFATKSIEYNYSRSELIVFGLSAGFATVLFLGLSIIILTILKSSIPVKVITILNFSVGIILTLYGVIRIIKILNYEH